MRKFEKVSYNDTGVIPTRNDIGSAGYDFFLVSTKKAQSRIPKGGKNY